MAATFDLVVRNGSVVTADSSFDADVGIRGETIVQIGGEMTGTHEIDASGNLVIPGGIDAHVHLTPTEGMLSGPRWCDDFVSGTREAARRFGRRSSAKRPRRHAMRSWTSFCTPS